MKARGTGEAADRPEILRKAIGRLAWGWLAVLTALGAVPAAFGAESVEVAAIVLSEQALEPGREQIVQVTLRNTAAGAASVGVRVTLNDKAGKSLDKPLQRVVAVNGYDEQRVYFTLKAPRQSGEYRVQLGLFSPDFKRRLTAQEPAFYATFTVAARRPAVAAQPPSSSAPQEAAPGPGAQKPSVRTFPAPPGLQFEAADLLWENIGVTPGNFLIGDTGRIRADLVNVGGDVARDVGVQVRYFNSRIPNKLESVADSTVAALAPGERIELEWEFKFPENGLLGEYRIVV